MNPTPKPDKENEKPRTWSILKCTNNGDKFIHGEDTKDNEFVDVIEHSAYEKLEAEFAKVVHEWQETCIALGKERAKSTALLRLVAEMREALVRLENGAIENQCDGCGMTTMLSYDNVTATEALASIDARLKELGIK